MFSAVAGNHCTIILFGNAALDRELTDFGNGSQRFAAKRSCRTIFQEFSLQGAF
jgi:hypothetical protein